MRKHVGSHSDPYDDAFWNFHDTGDWTGFARIVLRLLPSASIVDVGCGHGLALRAFRDVDPALRLRGFDDSPAAVGRARARQLDVSTLDFSALTRDEARAFAATSGTFDLALCLEVGEHLPPWHGAKLLDMLTCGRRPIFSAAQPNQGGVRHVNERAASYWIERLAERSFRLSSVDEALRNEVAALSLPWWYGQNIHVFDRI